MTSTYATAPTTHLADTGEHPTLAPDMPPMWHRPAGLVAAGCTLIGVSLLGFVVCGFISHESPAAVNILTHSSQLLAILGGGLLVAAWHARVLDTQARARIVAQQRRIDSLRDQVHSLGAIIAHCGGELRGLPEQVRQEMRHLQAAFNRAVDDRVAPIEQRVGELEQTVAAASTASAIIAQAEGSRVRPLRPNGATRPES